MSGQNVKIGIIGGTGLNKPDILEHVTEKWVDTPFGKPSSVLLIGKIKGVDCVVLSRHGREHNIMPTNVNFRANIHALKAEGCTHILMTTACGSLQMDKHPGDVVVLDQFIDRTQKRLQTFYDGSTSEYDGVLHMPLHTPFCPHTAKILQETAEELGIKHHKTGTVLTIEGPRFSSRAESKLWKSWGADVINMTTIPEVILAKEAGLCYAGLALVTDYDSWHESEEPVTVEMAMKTFRENVEKAKQILLTAIPKIASKNWDTIIKENKDTVYFSNMKNMK